MANTQQYTEAVELLVNALASDGTDELRVTAASTFPTDPENRAGRNLGKTRLMDSGETLIDPATEPTLAAIAAALASNATDHLLVQEETALDVSAATVPTEQQTPVGLEDSGGVQVDPATEGTLSSELAREIATWSAGAIPLRDTGGTQIDPATEPTLAAIAAALASNATDHLLVQEETALDVSAAPVGLEDTGGAQVDPAQNVDGASSSASTTSTGSGSAAAISVPDGRTTVTAAWDVSGSATVTVEVSPDGGTTWYQETTATPGSAETGTTTFQTGFDDARIYVDQNLNSASIGAKGA